jgi:hypothetical protein
MLGTRGVGGDGRFATVNSMISSSLSSCDIADHWRWVVNYFQNGVICCSGALSRQLKAFGAANARPSVLHCDCVGPGSLVVLAGGSWLPVSCAEVRRNARNPSYSIVIKKYVLVRYSYVGELVYSFLLVFCRTAWKVREVGQNPSTLSWQRYVLVGYQILVLGMIYFHPGEWQFYHPKREGQQNWSMTEVNQQWQLDSIFSPAWPPLSFRMIEFTMQ